MTSLTALALVRHDGGGGVDLFQGGGDGGVPGKPQFGADLI
jgi:hypothetical protein